MQLRKNIILYTFELGIIRELLHLLPDLSLGLVIQPSECTDNMQSMTIKIRVQHGLQLATVDLGS
jgi:hypothetical protein